MKMHDSHFSFFLIRVLQVIAQIEVVDIEVTRFNYTLNSGNVSVPFTLDAGTNATCNFTLNGVEKTVTSYDRVARNGHVDLDEITDSLTTGNP